MRIFSIPGLGRAGHGAETPVWRAGTMSGTPRAGTQWSGIRPTQEIAPRPQTRNLPGARCDAGAGSKAVPSITWICPVSPPRDTFRTSLPSSSRIPARRASHQKTGPYNRIGVIFSLVRIQSINRKYTASGFEPIADASIRGVRVGVEDRMNRAAAESRREAEPGIQKRAAGRTKVVALWSLRNRSPARGPAPVVTGNLHPLAG